jgi:fructosamine-3-kinase
VSDSVWQLLAEAIGTSAEVRPVAGGCINHSAILLLPSGRPVFAKTNSADKLPMFEAEAIGLKALEGSGVRVPEVLDCGVVGDYAYLILERIVMVRGTPRHHHRLGEKLAKLHRREPHDARFGFQRDNFIGATPQQNPWTDDWATFFAEHRIGYQLGLAAKRGDGFAHGDQLVARIPDLLAGHRPKPSLLHGDLWNGNVAFTLKGTPVIYDPACYYGDRETDIAFSEMFGGFEPEFYSGYRSVYPLDGGYEKRRDLYQLYHVLNHFNLFGHSYGEQAEVMIRKLLVGF